MQIVARKFEEEKVLAIAKYIYSTISIESARYRSDTKKEHRI